MSTSGSLKVIRVAVLFKLIVRSIFKQIHPNAVKAVKISGKAISAERVGEITAHILLYFVVLFFSRFSICIISAIAQEPELIKRDARHFYKYLIGSGYTQENLKLKDYRAAFGAGNVVAYVDSSWGYAQIGEVDPKAADFTVTSFLPTTMGTYGKGESLVESHCFLIGDGLSNGQKEAISLFIQHCTSTENLEGYLNNIGLAFVAHEGLSDCRISPIRRSLS